MASARDRELEHEYDMRRLQVVSQFGNRGILALCFFGFLTCVYLCVRCLAGKQTWADFEFRALAELKANHWAAIIISWFLTAGSTSWALGERYLRKQHIRRISGETAELQKAIDAKRRSSGLSLEGNTNPEDL